MIARLSSAVVCTVYFLGSTASAQSGGPRVTIDTAPSGAKVYLDGKEQGIVCLSGAACKPRLPVGTHRLTIELDGHKTLDETIQVRGPQRFVFKLEPAPASLSIKTLATNASAQSGEVFIDGKLSGNVPTDVELSAGKHMVEVRRPGFQPFAESVEVKAGAKQPLYVVLVAEAKSQSLLGSLRVASQIDDSEVFVDGTSRGQAPLLLDDLAPGDHIVEAKPKSPAYASWRQTVRVSAGQQAAAYATFIAIAPQAEPLAMESYPITFVPRKMDNHYFVSLNAGQACSAPCTLQSEPGERVLNVRGDGEFRTSIQLPRSPSRVTIQRFTTGRLAAGIVLTTLSIPMLVFGGIYYDNPGSLPRDILPNTQQEADAMGISLLVVGSHLALGGILALSFTKTNQATVEGL